MLDELEGLDRSNGRYRIKMYMRRLGQRHMREKNREGIESWPIL